MAAGYWIKLYQDILKDPKMGRLSDSAWRRCIELFLLAGEQGSRDGFLPAAEDMAWELRVSVDQLNKDLAELERAGILTLTDGRWLVVNFKKRQAAVDGRERVQRHREKKAVTAQPVVSNEPETKEKPAGNESVTKGYTDIDKEEDKEPPLPPKGGESVSKTQTLVSYFSNQSKINPPNGKQKVAWREGWIEPLNDLLDLTADDVPAACGLIDRAIAHMRQNDLTIARPSSISSVAKMLHQKGINGNGRGNAVNIWQGLVGQMAAVGARGSPQVDEKTNLVIRACGGWQNLCQMDTREAERLFKGKYEQVAT